MIEFAIVLKKQSNRNLCHKYRIRQKKTYCKSVNSRLLHIALLYSNTLCRKLGQRLALKNKIEEDLRGRIDQLEKRQTQDDAVINVINRLVFSSVA